MEQQPVTLRADLRQRIEDQVGPMDAALAAAVVRVYHACSAAEFYEAERAVHGELVRRGDVIVGEVLGARVSDPALVQPAKELMVARAKAAGVEMKSHGCRATRVRLLGGTVVRLRTLQLLPVAPRRRGRKRGVGRRGVGGAGVYPALAVLGIAGQATPALRATVAREVADADSVSVARASLLERGLDLPHKTALRLTYLFAEHVLERRAEATEAVAASTQPPGPGELAGKHVVVALDGGRLRVRVNPKAGRRQAKTRHRRYQAPWREPKVLTIYVIGADGKKDPRHRALLDGTMGDCEEAFALLIGHLRLMGAHQAERLTLLGDGAGWIWARGDALRQALGLSPEQYTEVVDHGHAVEHLTKIADLVKTWGETTRDQWMKRARRLLKAGQIEALLDHLNSLCVGRRAKQVRDATGYFITHTERMRYAKFRTAGIPTGSGAIESGIRRIVNQRLKGNSIYWLEHHAEAVLHLRSYLKTGRWDDLVHIELEHPIWTPGGSDTA